VTGQSAESVYGAGAFRIAADSFAARAGARPDVPAHWFNLGDALYGMGEGSGARAAWVRAARLAPRDGMIQRALSLVPAPDENSAAATGASWVTPGEMMFAGAVLWIAAWLVLGFRRRGRLVVALMLAGAVCLALAIGKTEEYRRPVALVRHASTSLRAAPFASATSRRTMGEGTTVEVLSRYGGWFLVRRGSDRGWVQGSDLVAVGPISVQTSRRSAE
jgi:hypothetical protein